MKDRIVQFLGSQKITPAEFADKIGVQRSSMSHILNGRNYPSASFLQKMLQVYPLLNPRWLMIGDGEMNSVLPQDLIQPPATQEGSMSDSILDESISSNTQFNYAVVTASADEAKKDIEACHQTTRGGERFAPPIISEISPAQENQGKAEYPDVKPKLTTSFSDPSEEKREIEQILFFYKDKTFTAYKPS